VQCGGQQYSVAQGQSLDVSCSSAAGRYVFVGIPGGSKILTLCEVAVKAHSGGVASTNDGCNSQAKAMAENVLEDLKFCGPNSNGALMNTALWNATLVDGLTPTTMMCTGTDAGNNWARDLILNGPAHVTCHNQQGTDRVKSVELQGTVISSAKVKKDSAYAITIPGLACDANEANNAARPTCSTHGRSAACGWYDELFELDLMWIKVAICVAYSGIGSDRTRADDCVVRKWGYVYGAKHLGWTSPAQNGCAAKTTYQNPAGDSASWAADLFASGTLTTLNLNNIQQIAANEFRTF